MKEQDIRIIKDNIKYIENNGIPRSELYNKQTFYDKITVIKNIIKKY